MDKLLKLAIIIAVLMAGGAVFYHYVVFLPGEEQAKREQAESQQRAAAQREESQQRAAALRDASRKVAYEECKDTARRSYDANWAAACKGAAKQRRVGFENCLEDRAVMSNQFMGKPYCEKTYGGEIDESGQCSLSGARSETINGIYKDAQEKCMAEAKSGLTEASFVRP